MSNYWGESWPLWVSAFCVIAVYTYLFKDNALYRVMTQIFIGLNLGYQAVIQWRDVLYPQWWLPMNDGFHAMFGGPGSPWGALWALVGVIGLLFYFQLSRKHASLSKIAIGITIGIGAGLTFKSQLGQNIPQILDSFKPLAPSIVRPKPRTVATLPGSIVPPTVDGSLAFFVNGASISANEVLGGTPIWKANLPAPPTGEVTVEGNELRIPLKQSTLRMDRSTGTQLGIAATAAAPTMLEIRQQQDHVAAFSGKQVLWVSSEPSRYLGTSAGRVLVLAGLRLLILDPLDGKQTAVCTLSRAPTAVPVVATYRQPQFGNGVVLVPTGSLLEAFAIREAISEGIHSGDLLWSAAYDEPIVGVRSFDGVTLVSGASRSAIWEIPAPQAKLTVGDYFDNWVSVITVLCVMSYFFFSFRRREPLTVAASNAGRWMLMIGFGAFFGNTVMTRMSFLLDRLMFLIDDWLRPFFHHIFR